MLAPLLGLGVGIQRFHARANARARATFPPEHRRARVEREIEAAQLDDLDPAGMRAVQLGDESILLLRDGDAVHAVGGKCPHAGAPLAQGVRHGLTIICPWHKAAFCARSGAMLAPPAVDDLPRYDTRVQAGRVFVRVPAVPPTPPNPPAEERHFVIIGGGAAGAVAAQTLRQEGFGGRITMIDREGRVPYDRTVLSKYWLSGEKGAEKSPLQTQSFYRDHHIGRIAADIIHVDAATRHIECANGQSFDADAILLAPGGDPKRPTIPGADLAGVFVLRSRADAEAILAHAERSTRAVIVGAGFIGMEVAASLRERGLGVVVVAQDSVPFEKQLGKEVGSAFVSLHESRGVVFKLGCEVASVEGKFTVRDVVLKDGSRVPADLVVFGFGIAPATEFVSGIVKRPDGGIEVDAGLKAADGVFAAGDVAWFPHRGDGPRLRVEHWRVAQQHGRVAALNMLGRHASFDAVPVFWTIQYMKRLDYVGHAESWDDIIVHGDPRKPQFLAYYVKDGHVIAAAGMDRDRDMAALIALFDRRRDWTAAALGHDPAAVLAAE
jgi:NADPH-dependent 2,4-dienoyl-CoA reductase/sulfur reductase-like enzyme/nitrite reductase/ring-hydroxylating ferredoxin subunit